MLEADIVGYGMVGGVAFVGVAKASKSLVQRIVETVDSLLDIFRPDSATTVEEAFSIDDVIDKNPHKGELYRCVELADSLAKELTNHNQKFEKVNVDFWFGNGEVFSCGNGMLIVSQNGHHEGILYSGKVYCNLYPRGLPEILWVNDFIGSGIKEYYKGHRKYKPDN